MLYNSNERTPLSPPPFPLTLIPCNYPLVASGVSPQYSSFILPQSFVAFTKVQYIRDLFPQNLYLLVLPLPLRPTTT